MGARGACGMLHVCRNLGGMYCRELEVRLVDYLGTYRGVSSGASFLETAILGTAKVTGRVMRGDQMGCAVQCNAAARCDAKQIRSRKYYV
jgi:hypothetical protein